MFEQPIRPISRIWINRLTAVGIPTDGTVVEVAPGHEPKIGTALAMLGFVGTIVLIEPDSSAAAAIHKIYKHMLPNANVRVITKQLQDVQAGTDIPTSIDALLANHAFDDMIMSCILGHTSCPNDEPYPSLTPVDFSRGTKATILAWKNAIETLAPAVCIVSQYPVRVLSQPGFEERQNSGYKVLDHLKVIYEQYASQSSQAHSPIGSDYSDNPRWREDLRWWLIARFRSIGITDANG